MPRGSIPSGFYVKKQVCFACNRRIYMIKYLTYLRQGFTNNSDVLRGCGQINFSDGGKTNGKDGKEGHHRRLRHEGG